ncbi:MAG: DUF819 family protein [Gammaproteobacteria bacterium]|nr:DUF819 family protein [Gammaproteobacteria bacterium]
MEESHALITNDAVVLGLLMALLAFVFKTSSSDHPSLKKFYSIIPMLLLCYFLPSLLNTFGIVDGEHSNLYFIASRYLLPACLILLTLSVDLKEIAHLGYKPVVMFLAGTTGIIIGGPLAILLVSAFNPELVGGAGPEAVWRGMTTVAGSWIGGGANQAAMYEVFSPSNSLFGIMITVDILVAEVWMAFLLIGIGKKDAIDRFFKADSSSVDHLQKKMEEFGKSIERNPTTSDLMVMLGIAFAATALSHFLADIIAPYIQTNAPYLSTFSLTSGFFWLIIISTSIGVILSFTKAREYEGAGASKIGTVFIFVLVATIGMKMDIRSLGDYPGLFMVGGIWMLIHIVILVVVGRLIRAPYFFLAVGSKANIGGAASAPVLAAAFHPALAPVGVLLAVFGYVLGTYGAWLCGLLMQTVAPQM